MNGQVVFLQLSKTTWINFEEIVMKSRYTLAALAFAFALALATAASGQIVSGVMTVTGAEMH